MMKNSLDAERKEIRSNNIALKKRKFDYRRWMPLYLLVLPAVLIVILFSYLPMTGILLAFKEYDPKGGILGSPWVGLYGFYNFVEIFRTPALVESIWNTLYMNAVSLVLGFFAPILFALMISEIRLKPFKKVVQTISYLPHFLSWAVITAMINNLLNDYGMINSLLHTFGAEPVYLMKEPGAFLPVYWVTVVWQSVGWGSIIYIATIAGINTELYEAAAIDGAGRWKQVMHITLPGILPTAMILLILSVGSLFGSNFELVYGLQNQVAWTMEVISTSTYKYGIGGSTPSTYSLSVALGLMQGIVAIILTFSVNALSNRVAKVSMW